MTFIKKFMDGFSLTEQEKDVAQKETEGHEIGYWRSGQTKALKEQGSYPPDFCGRVRRGIKNICNSEVGK